ncbi:squalene synthase HpnD, partial [Streptomyces rimosus]
LPGREMAFVAVRGLSGFDARAIGRRQAARAAGRPPVRRRG